MSYKIVGISGSPVKKGNLDTFLGSIMDLASEKGLDTACIYHSGYDSSDQSCLHQSARRRGSCQQTWGREF